MNLIDHLDKYPPYVIRLCAHDGIQPLTDRQIANASGLSTNTVWRVSHAKSWSSISVGVASKFASACGMDIMRPRRLKEYLASAKFAHFKKNPNYYKRLMK